MVEHAQRCRASGDTLVGLFPPLIEKAPREQQRKEKDPCGDHDWRAEKFRHSELSAEQGQHDGAELNHEIH